MIFSAVITEAKVGGDVADNPEMWTMTQFVTGCMARVFSGCCINCEMNHRNVCVGGMPRRLPS